MFLIVTTLLAAFAAATPPARVHHRPSPAVIERWTEALFEQGTLWVFPDSRDLEALMARTSVEPSLRAELRALVTDTLSPDVFHRAQSFFEVPAPPRAYVLVPNALWDRLPPTFLRAVYLDHLRRERGDGSFLKFRVLPIPRPWRGAATRLRLRPFAVDAKAAAALAGFAVEYEGRVRVPVVPATWRYLTRIMREAVVETFLSPIPEREGLNLDTPPRLPPFLSARVGRYACASGANCFNIVENLFASADAVEGPTSFAALDRLLADGYREIDVARHPLEPGDLMVYRRPWDEGGAFMVYNVSLSVAPGQIVTKNGLAKFVPYVVEDLIHDYARNQRSKPFTLTIYRHRDPDAYRRACEGALR